MSDQSKAGEWVVGAPDSYSRSPAGWIVVRVLRETPKQVRYAGWSNREKAMAKDDIKVRCDTRERAEAILEAARKAWIAGTAAVSDAEAAFRNAELQANEARRVALAPFDAAKRAAMDARWNAVQAVVEAA